MLRVLRINCLVFLVLIVGIEAFFQLNFYFHILGREFYTPYKVRAHHLSQEDILSEFGPAGMDPIPKENKSPAKDFLEKYVRQGNVEIEKSDIERGSEIQSQRRVKGTQDIVYDVTYKLNSHHLRAVDQSDQKRAEQFIIAAGCSFTFGEGVDQGKDYPSVLQKEVGKKWRVYNLGQRGAGPNTILRNFKDRPALYQNLVQEKEGVFIWYYIDSHLIRALCPLSCYSLKINEFIRDYPEYQLDGDELIERKIFSASWSPQRLLNKFLGFSKTLLFFKIDFPDPYSLESNKLLFKILDQIVLNIEAEGKKVNKKILVTNWNGDNPDNVRIMAQKFNYEVVDFDKLRSFRRDMNASLQVDKHPTSESHWLLAHTLKSKYFK